MGEAQSDLVIASQAGSIDAFGQLVRTHEAQVGAVAIAALGGAQSADDIVQDAFVAGWQQIADLKDPTKFRSWICAIARNQAHNRRRVFDRELLCAEFSQEKTPGTPRSALLEDERRGALAVALDEIPTEHREAIVLYYREDCSIREVARALALTEAAAQKRISRGRVALRQALRSFLSDALPATRSAAGVSAAVLVALAAIPRASAQGAAITHNSSKGIVSMKIIVTTSVLTLVLGTSYWLQGAYADKAKIEPRHETRNATHSVASGEQQATPSKRSPRRLVPARTSPVGTSKALGRPSAAMAEGKSEKLGIKQSLLGDYNAEVQFLVDECMALARIENPDLFGTVMVDAKISMDPATLGFVTTATIRQPPQGDKLSGSGLAECLVETLMAIEFTGLPKGDANEEFDASLRFYFSLPLHLVPADRTAVERLIARTSVPGQLFDIAMELSKAYPELGLRACDKGSPRQGTQENIVLCTLMACRQKDADRVGRYWTPSHVSENMIEHTTRLCALMDSSLPEAPLGIGDVLDERR